MSRTKPTLPPVDVYRLLSDGIAAPLRYGVRRAFKHTGPSLTDEEIDRLVEAQGDELMNWFCETFRFPEVK